MNIKQFVEESERQFDEQFNNSKWPHHDLGPDYKPWPVHTKAFTSSKLRELIGELKKEVEGMKIVPKHHEACLNTEHKDMCDCSELYADTRHNAVLDSVLHLLDEAGGGK